MSIIKIIADREYVSQVISENTIDFIKSVNGVQPDESGNVQIEINIDATLTQEGQAADAKAVGDKITGLEADIANLNAGGISATAKGLLIAILRAGVYSGDQSANITALDAALGNSSAFIITNNLTNVTSSNSAASVEENEAYTATLTAAEGYELDSVTVTMGGVDVTADVYADGVVTIGAVTGNVEITAVAVESSGSGGDSGVEVIALAPYLKAENKYITTIYNGETIRWNDKDSSNIYSVPVEAGTYRLSYTADNNYTNLLINNVNIKTIEVDKLPLLNADTDLSTVSIPHTTAESVTTQYAVAQDDGSYLYAADVVFAADGYFLFSIDEVNSYEWTFAKVVA